MSAKSPSDKPPAHASGAQKRILMVNYEFPPLGGGGGVAAHAIAKGFIANGYEVDYLTSWYEGLERYEIVDDIHVHRVRVIGRTGLHTATMVSLLSYPIAGFFKGAALCSTRHYRFINTHFAVPSGPLGFALGLLFGIPNILSIHGGDIYDPALKRSPHRHWYLRAAVRFFMDHARAVVAQSSNTRDNAVRYFAPKHDVQIIPLPYEPARFKPATREQLGLDPSKKYLIGVGRLVTRKDFGTFLRALALLDDSYEGIIVGDGPERGRLEALAAELGIAGRVRFAGAVESDIKFQYLANADVYVLSSLHEGFGIVLQEAMQAELPIVATNEGGQTDLVREGVNGFLVPVGDAHAIADAVRKALAAPLPGLSGQVAQFDPSRIAAQYEALGNPERA